MTGSDSGETAPSTVANSVSTDVVGTVIQAGSIAGDVVVHQRLDNPRGVPHQVPPPPDGFVDRAEELGELTNWLHVTAREPARITVISGQPGVGKSALVRHLAAQLATRYPGGQLYVDYSALRTHDGAAIGDALADCLRSLGVPPNDIPDRLGARANLFRTKTAEQPVLVVLDDVDEPAQVRPLVPNSTGSTVLATSNARLSELALDGARLVTLPPMGEAKGITLLRTICGSERIDSGQKAAKRLVKLCGGLPVAIQVAAARLVSRPRLSITALTEELESEKHRLAALSVRGQRLVSSIFNNAYNSLPPTAGELYWRLGATPVQSISIEVAAVASQLHGDDLSRQLDVLVDANLIDDDGPDDHYRFHDLVRLHAQEEASRKNPEIVNDVVQDVKRYYLRKAAFADRTIMGQRLRIADHTDLLRGFEDPFDASKKVAAALDWMANERSNLLTVLQAAFDRGSNDYVWQLAEALIALYLNRRYLDDWLEATDLGVAAAERADNPAAEARLRGLVSRAYLDLERPDLAWENLDKALPLAEKSGNELLIASTWEFIGRARAHARDHHGAVAAYKEAERRSRDAKEPRGEALAQFFRGRELHAVGDSLGALQLLNDAREALRRVGDARMADRVSISLGELLSDLKRYSAAQAELEAAVRAFSNSKTSHYQAQAEDALATLLQKAGRPAAAQEHRDRAIKLRSQSV
ncbi:AAA family ATPase [Kibdelosporangium lantanae]|uniref:AAA family ATPase n=1 Tax=Kibdelosporangium lantanae TaxID=1497396 RepID=A0ABW3M2H0_9PSEU